MPPLFGAVGHLCQGPALPAHFLCDLPAETGGGRSLPAPLPGVRHPCPGPDRGGAPRKPAACAAPGGAPGPLGARQRHSASHLRPTPMRGGSAARESNQREARAP